jgi:hypothetical protein
MTEERFPKKPMKFGSEEDFYVAIAELKWIKSFRGNLKDEDVEQIANKYLFPFDFLKEGLKGLKYPEDFIPSKSKWFPILYAWQYRGNIVENVWKRAATYAKARYDFFRILLITPASVGVIIWFLLSSGLSLSYMFPAVGIIVSVLLTLWRRLEDRAEKLEVAKRLAELEGLSEDAAYAIQFALSYPLLTYYTQKKGESLSLVLFPMGSIEEEEPLSPFRHFLEKLGISKETVKIKKKRIPVFWAENPEREYIERLTQLFKDQS